MFTPLKIRSKHIRLQITLLLIICLFGCKATDDLDISTNADFEAFLNEEMDFQRIPAMSVLMFEGSTVKYERYFGKSHIANGTDLASDHLFLLASISKTITATALLQLYEKGLFDLDDKVNNYLPFHVSVPGQSTGITFRMLLTHTSAIADGPALDDQYYYGQDSPVTLEYWLSNYLIAGGDFYNESENFYDFEPGTKHEYSNQGNALIGLLVEQIAQQDFNAYCKENIFVPLGMTNTFWRLDEINQTIVQPYTYESREHKEIQHYTFTDYPNGGLRSTGTDLFYFLSNIAQGGTSNGHQLLKAETVSQMLQLQIPTLSNDMGLHFFLMNAEHNLWGHDGGEQGVATIMAFDPETKIGAIILANEGEADLDEILVEAFKYAKTL